MDQKLYEKNAGFVPRLNRKVLELAKLQPHESVLDFGCGDGVLTKQLQETQSRVVGIDNQEDMIEAAQRAGVRDARVVSAQELKAQSDLQQEDFDVVFTNAVLHWIPDLADTQNPYILKAILKALKPGGRFVGECGAFVNVAEIVSVVCLSLVHHGIPAQKIKDEVMPFFFPTDDVWRSILEQVGFRVESVESEARVTLLPGKVSDWAQTFLERFLKQAGDRRDEVLQDLDTAMEFTNKDEQGRYYANYRRLRFVAWKN